MNKNEKILMDYNKQERMTGNESYAIIGKRLSILDGFTLMAACIGLILTADCDKKAFLTKRYLQNKGEVGWKMVLGSIKIFSLDMLATYGHDCNPPYEFHSWLEKEENEKKLIIDIALPGTIIRGLRAKDEIGSFLKGRKPIILAGEAPDWIKYEAKIIMKDN